MMEQISVEWWIDTFGLVMSLGILLLARTRDLAKPYRPEAAMMDAALLLPDLRICRRCGCTDLHACPGGCSWVLLDVDAPSGVCSQCAEEMDWDPVGMETIETGLDRLEARLAGAA